LEVEIVDEKGRKMEAKSGFTLVEILIVVCILGILAAIVIPQYSESSTEAKFSSLCTDLQTLRSQIELYKIQHNNFPPSFVNFVAQMTTYSDISGNTAAAKTVVFYYGPYMQKVPVNDWFKPYRDFVAQETLFKVVSIIKGDRPGDKLKFRH
jgi:general secretion pathway protein G